jgi:L-alanine-DL-glutamate epimerase-like enolase superfamily enzyme
VNNTDRILEIDSATCEFELDEPLEIGGRLIARREYTVARVTTGGGIHGQAYAYSRGAPLHEVINGALAEELVGENWWDVYRLHEWTTALESAAPKDLIRRAYALIDLCLWDIRGKAVGLPLWQLLGGYRRTIPVILVEGYPRRNEDCRVFAERIASRVDEGFHAIKIAYSGGAVEAEERLRETRGRVGADVRLIMDAVWAWTDVDEALRAVKRWSAYDLAWVEDPFPAEEVSAIRTLRRAVTTPIGVGDDLTSLTTLLALLNADAIDVVRLDVTELGSVGRFQAAMAFASRYGRAVSPHIYPEVHQHFAFAQPGVAYVEFFPADSPFWCTEKFVRSDVHDRVHDGQLTAPSEPGLGIEVDWDVVAAHGTSARAEVPFTM